MGGNPYNPIHTYAIIRLYGYAGVSHIVVTNCGIKAYGSRLPPLFNDWLQSHNDVDCCRFLDRSTVIFGDDIFDEY